MQGKNFLLTVTHNVPGGYYDLTGIRKRVSCKNFKFAEALQVRDLGHCPEVFGDFPHCFVNFLQYLQALFARDIVILAGLHDSEAWGGVVVWWCGSVVEDEVVGKDSKPA